MGVGWNLTLGLARRRLVSSTQRGLGPPRQSEPLNFAMLVLISFGWAAIVPGGRVNTLGVLMLFSMCLLRELDLQMLAINI